MNENKFWLCFYGLVAAVLTTFILSILGYNAHNDYLLAQMVKDGVDPLRAKCALQRGDAVCVILAAQGAK